MSRQLAEFLGLNQAIFNTDIRRLEAASGYHSLDIRLSTEIIATRRRKLQELGLDVQDTTGKEMYHALLGLAQQHDDFLAKRAGGKSTDAAEDLLPKLIKLAQSAKIPRTVWVLKHSAAKRLIKQQVPRRTMKYLGYKSVDSLLKRVPVAEIYAGIILTETDEWRKKLIERYDQLTPMDFETRPISIVSLDQKKWGKAAADFVRKQRHIVTCVQEIGAILVLPGPIATRPGLSLVVLPQLLSQMNELRLHATYYKMQQMQPGFGRRFANSITAGSPGDVYMASQRVPWRVVQRHFGRDSLSQHSEVFEPHVQPDDFSWRKVESIMFKLEPTLSFWDDTDHVAFMDKKPVSFNLIDVSICLFNRLSYEQRIYQNFQENLQNEIFVRYMGASALERQVLRQIDHQAMSYSALPTTEELV